METLRQSLIPRRISRLYADTKRSYEQMIQHSITNASQTATHTKLRIQKDRLIAWGLEWADSNAAQDGDIDGSLDRAGISDLVASIMSTILDLLERADGIQPQRTISFAGPYPDDKPGLTTHQTPQWTTHDLNRLNDIVKDLTTSIDTLCDLSRSRQALNQVQYTSSWAAKPDIPTDFSTPNKDLLVQESPNLIQATRIWEALLHIPDPDKTPAMSSSPPSYESVAASSEDRILAYMEVPDSPVMSSLMERNKIPVLMEYLPVIDVVSTGQHEVPLERYGDLMHVQPTVLAGLGPTYLGTLKLRGWVIDTRRARRALVYEIPLPGLSMNFVQSTPPRNFTLLSFLHHGADTDSTNMPSLEDRFRLAFNLSSTLLHLHAKGLPHRNINSRNVIFFTNDEMEISGDNKPWKNGIIRRPFLTSFDQCTEDVYVETEEPFISNIYRHPHSERGQRSLFKPCYDIYSLGLILLEIGLWMPISKLWKTRYSRANFKSRLQTVYTRKLAGKCGTNYMKVVEHCLRAGDETSDPESSCKPQPEKADYFSTTQNSLYWKAFKVLQRCCMIDDYEDSAVPGDDAPDFPATQLETDQNKAQESSAEAGLLTKKVDQDSKEIPASPHAIPPPEQSAEPAQKPRCKVKVWSHEIPAAFYTHWQQSLEPKLNRMFSRIIDRWESYSIELLMAGETPEAAKPTIYMVCASVDKARKVLQYVNQDKGLFDIKVSSGQILRSKAGRKRRRGKGKRAPLTKLASTKVEDRGKEKEINHYQERPTCGASIGAYLDEQHLPPVSFGGTVLVDGEPYGMSVHHMLETDDIDMGLDDEVIPQRSMAPAGGCDRDSKDDHSRHWTIEAGPEALYPFEISDDEDEGYRSGPEEEDDAFDFDPSKWDRDDTDDLDDVDMGDTPGVEPGQGETLLVTQPAIDDVDEGFFPNEEDVDEDHIASHTLGYIHASSGIRRTSRGSVSHEVDWALIKIREHRRGETNTIKDGTRHCRTVTPCGVVKANDLGGLKVHALGRTSGLQTGTILPSMVIVKMPGRISHSQSWQVAGNFGMGGDSGAWVIDNDTGGVCAHVLAWSERCNTAYVAPMEVLFEDIAQRLGVDVMLPGQDSGPRTKSVNDAFGESLVEATATLGIKDAAPSEAPAKPKQAELPVLSALSRESTTSPPVATSPPPSRHALGPIDNVVKGCLREAKKKSGSEAVLEKGEEGCKVGWRMNVG
ncbi:MAG: hypothetical protein LQ352_004386 [Teloschistes flavicans]|nr:MAG: hypothetical protein LQ352_004386 [Teloschistes flavicans]